VTITRAVRSEGWIDASRTRHDGPIPNAVAVDLAELLNVVDFPMIVIHRDLTIAGFNQSAADVLGLVPSHINRSAREVAALADLRNLEDLCSQAIAVGTSVRRDFWYENKSFVLKITSYKQSDGRISGTLLSFTNVTAFRASIDQAIYEREYAKAILNSASDPFVVLNTDLRIQTANRPFFTFFRISREEIQNLPFFTLGNSVFDRADLRERLQELLSANGECQPLEIDCDLPGSGRRTLLLNARKFSLRGPHVLILLTFQDVTAQKAAHEITQRLATIVETSDDAIISKSLDGIITSWNKGAERIFGYLAEEVIGKSIMILIPPDRREDENLIIERVRAGQRIEHYETVRQRKHGSLIDISLTVSPIRNAEGRVIGASKIARDITERKRTEQAITALEWELASDFGDMLRLQEISRRLVPQQDLQKLLGEILDAAMQITRADFGNIQLLDRSDGGLRIHEQRGFGPEFLDFFNSVHEGMAACGTALESGQRVIVADVANDPIFKGTAAREVMLRAKAVAVQSTPLLARSGELLGVLSTHYSSIHRPNDRDLRQLDVLARQAADLIDRTLAQEAIRRSESNLRDFIENASVALHWVGPDGTILWANQTELDLLGYEREEYIGHHIAKFHVDQPIIKDILRRLTNRETIHECEARLRCKNGSIRHVLIDSNVLWDGDKFVHTRCFTRDITERKRNEELVTTLAREAEHRAKNILATVQATVHLAHSDTPQGLKQAIEGRIAALANVHRLFVQSRWEGADLHDLVAHELSPYCPDGSRRVRINGPNLLLRPDLAQMIAIVMHELATNAAKYGALSLPDGRVQVEWSRATNGRIVLRWIEMDGPHVEPPAHHGFGTRVMESMIRGQLGGEMNFDWRPQGLGCEIILPAE
jgi:PAS domain S-box-containing protein